jgi:hypothetical protein
MHTTLVGRLAATLRMKNGRIGDDNVVVILSLFEKRSVFCV